MSRLQVTPLKSVYLAERDVQQVHPAGSGVIQYRKGATAAFTDGATLQVTTVNNGVTVAVAHKLDWTGISDLIKQLHEVAAQYDVPAGWEKQ